MQDEEKLDAFIEATVDDTLEGLEDLLPPEAMACVRGRLVDDLHVHPELSRMAREHAPRERTRSTRHLLPWVTTDRYDRGHGKA